MRQHLYKYFPKREWAEQFLDGSIYFNSLGYFRAYEDGEVRGDKYEGTSRYAPAEGLVLFNQTQGKSSNPPRSGFESSVKGEEIFVICASLSFAGELWEKFEAVACVEITRIQSMCTRIRKAMPKGSTFYNRAVKYYDPKEPPAERWAIPDLIATSKVEGFSWQDEYRFVFSPTDALAFENVQTQITIGEPQVPKPDKHEYRRIQTRSLRDFCRLRELSSAELVKNQPERSAVRKAAGAP